MLKRTTKMQWMDRGWYIVTEFERSISVNFPRAVKLAETHPGFIQLMDERNVLIYRNIYREQDLLQFQELYKLIRNWKGSKLYIKGDEVDFELVEPGIECYIQTKLLNDHTPDSCNRWQTSTFLGCLGCHRSHVRMEWQTSSPDEYPCWYFFGKLNRYQVYIINKEDLENTVIGHLIEYQYCPLLDLDQIRNLVRRLPDRIDPRKDKAWTYNPNRREQKNTIPSKEPPFVGSSFKLEPTRHEQKNTIPSKEPAVLPVSEAQYKAYLKRKLQWG